MERTIYTKLKAWKNSPRRKPLVLKGARQVGKTHALVQFGKSNYETVAYFNFEKEEKLARYFEESLDPKKLIPKLSIHANTEITKEKTLLIFDEIQECPKALNSLKYFCEEANEYHVATAGSLLGVKVAQGKGFPVGKVNFLSMFPLTFLEFLTSFGEKKLHALLEETPLSPSFLNSFHEKLLDYLKLYLFIGGMPEAILTYQKAQNLKEVREVHLEILDAYEQDFSKHAPPQEVMKILTLWKQVPRQLAKENKKFLFASIRKSARAREYETALQWLTDAGLIHKSLHVATPKFPLNAYADTHIFKLFLSDVGLLGAQSHLPSRALLEPTQLFTEFKEALTENFVVQEHVAQQIHPPYYWTSKASAEIDLLIEKETGIYPVEIKSGTSLKKKSLKVYQERYHPTHSFRISSLSFKEEEQLTNYPLYLSERLAKDIF